MTVPPPIPRPLLAVGAVVWNAAGEVLLIRRAKPPRQGAWSIPGGKVEWGESLHEALAREVREETGLAISIGDMIEVVESRIPDADGSTLHHYVLIDFTADAIGREVCAGDDASDARFVSLSDLVLYELWSETLRIIEKSARLRTGG